MQSQIPEQDWLSKFNQVFSSLIPEDREEVIVNKLDNSNLSLSERLSIAFSKELAISTSIDIKKIDRGDLFNMNLVTNDTRNINWYSPALPYDKSNNRLSIQDIDTNTNFSAWSKLSLMYILLVASKYGLSINPAKMARPIANAERDINISRIEKVFIKVVDHSLEVFNAFRQLITSLNPIKYNNDEENYL